MCAYTRALSNCQVSGLCVYVLYTPTHNCINSNSLQEPGIPSAISVRLPSLYLSSEVLFRRAKILGRTVSACASRPSMARCFFLHSVNICSLFCNSMAASFHNNDIEGVVFVVCYQVCISLSLDKGTAGRFRSKSFCLLYM